MLTKEGLPKPTYNIREQEYVKVCPLCGESNFIKDYKRAELYCGSCGLVISSPQVYCGTGKTYYPKPHSAPAEAENGVHYRWVHKSEKGKYSSYSITNYRHNLTNEQLMKRGQGRHLRPL